MTRKKVKKFKPRKSRTPLKQLKRGVGIAGRTKSQIAQLMAGEEVDRTPKAYKAFPKPPKNIKGAKRVKLFFKRYITHTTGKWKGKKFNLLPWQIDLIDKLFGRLKKNGLRQYKQCYLEIAKKNGKTELAAALGLYLLVWDEEGSPEVALAASDRKQASICFDVAAQMVRQNENLSASVKILISQKKLYQRHSNGTLEVLSSETASKHGYNLSGLIFDELHAQKTPDLYRVLTEGSGAARQQPLFLYLTTAGWDRKSICWEVHNYAKQIMKGVIKDETFLPIIYSMKEKADWKKEKNWHAPNPALGVIFDIDNLREGFKKATQMPTFENDFRRLRLNEWVQQHVRWISLEEWDKCKGEINPLSFMKKPCYGGLDLSSTQDLTAFVLVFLIDGKYVIFPFFFCPEDNIRQRSKKDKVPYDVWEKMGLLIATPGNVIDYGFVQKTIIECKKLYNLKSVAFDRYKASELVQNLADEGITVIPIGQNYKEMNAPIGELEKLILGRKIIHGGNPVLRWMCNNVALRKDPSGLMKFDKEKSNEKIDGMVALVMALDQAIRHSKPTGPPIIVLGPDTTKEEDIMSKGKKEKKAKGSDVIVLGKEEKPKPSDEFFCKRCRRDTEGKDFCGDCGLKRNL